MTDALAPYRATHQQTDVMMSRVSGLARALYELLSEHPALHNPEPITNAILSLAVVLEEKAVQAQAQHSAEWGHVVKPQAASTA